MSQINSKAGYLVTALGCFFGGVIGALIGWGLSEAYVNSITSDPKIGATVFLLKGVFGGLWVGSVLCCWLGLRLGRFPRAFQTALILAILILPPVLLALFTWTILIHLALPAAVMTLFGLPLMARYVSNRTSD